MRGKSTPKGDVAYAQIWGRMTRQNWNEQPRLRDLAEEVEFDVWLDVSALVEEVDWEVEETVQDETAPARMAAAVLRARLYGGMIHPTHHSG